MNRYIFLIVASIGLVIPATAQKDAETYKEEGYKLIWADGFDVDGKVNKKRKIS